MTAAPVTRIKAAPARPPANDLDGAVFIALVRCWVSARQRGEAPQPHMSAKIQPLVLCPTLVPACDSLLQLVEAQLGRPLATECCCSKTLSRDERALLLLLANACDGPAPFADPVVPHGLPGAMSWAVRSVAIALGGPVLSLSAAGGCPFSDVAAAHGTGHRDAV